MVGLFGKTKASSPSLVSLSVAFKSSSLTTLYLQPALSFLYHLAPRCSRLSLQPLAYLWRRDQESLLSEMISSDLHAILIKVAAFGEFLFHFFVSVAPGEQSDVFLPAAAPFRSNSVRQRNRKDRIWINAEVWRRQERGGTRERRETSRVMSSPLIPGSAAVLRLVPAAEVLKQRTI